MKKIKVQRTGQSRAGVLNFSLHRGADDFISIFVVSVRFTHPEVIIYIFIRTPLFRLLLPASFAIIFKSILGCLVRCIDIHCQKELGPPLSSPVSRESFH